MSHFGLHLGPENPFTSLLPTAYTLALFSPAEIDAAFVAHARGRSEVALDEVRRLTDNPPVLLTLAFPLQAHHSLALHPLCAHSSSLYSLACFEARRLRRS